MNITPTERITAAAIQFEGKVYTGWRHDRIGIKMVMEGVCTRYPSGKAQGFVTSTGRFVGRKEALAIALVADQVPKDYPKNILCSEYVWNLEGKEYGSTHQHRW